MTIEYGSLNHYKFSRDFKSEVLVLAEYTLQKAQEEITDLKKQVTKLFWSMEIKDDALGALTNDVHKLRNKIEDELKRSGSKFGGPERREVTFDRSEEPENYWEGRKSRTF